MTSRLEAPSRSRYSQILLAKTVGTAASINSLVELPNEGEVIYLQLPVEISECQRVHGAAQVEISDIAVPQGDVRHPHIGRIVRAGTLSRNYRPIPKNLVKMQ